MTRWQNYHLAASVDDALQALTGAAGEAWVIAGGTDLLLDIEQGRHAAAHLLVDVTRIEEMAVIELRSKSLFVGAATPLNKVVASSLVARHAQALCEAAALIGGPQVRNTATLGGNVAHALPAADGAIALVALDAQAEIAGGDGRKTAPVASLFRGPGQSALHAGHEIVVGFHLPLRLPGQGSAFQRVMRPQGVAIAILNMAVWLERRGDVVAAVRIAAGPSGPVPRRLTGAETALTGSTPDAACVEGAAAALLAEARFRTSPHRATVEYRRHVARVLLAGTLAAAWERAA